MTETARRAPTTTGLHAAIIMDGNGRWARARGLPRVAGHREGVGAVRRTVEAAPGLGIATLTLYAFSRDNWSRPPSEVAALLGLLGRYLERECARAANAGVRVSVIGLRDRLPPPLVRSIRAIEAATSCGKRLHLRLAVDYSSREAILAAARHARCARAFSVRRFSRLVNRAAHSPPESPPVDLLIRTGGERRLSDFLLWESAYAELIFTDQPWPDFTERDFASAVDEFHGRARRFGGLSPATSRRA